MRWYDDSNQLTERDVYVYDTAGHVDEISAYNGSNQHVADFFYNDAGTMVADNWFYANGTQIPEAQEPDYDPYVDYNPDPPTDYYFF